MEKINEDEASLNGSSIFQKNLFPVIKKYFLIELITLIIIILKIIIKVKLTQKIFKDLIYSQIIQLKKKIRNKWIVSNHLLKA